MFYFHLLSLDFVAILVLSVLSPQYFQRNVPKNAISERSLKGKASFDKDAHPLLTFQFYVSFEAESKVCSSLTQSPVTWEFQAKMNLFLHSFLFLTYPWIGHWDKKMGQLSGDQALIGLFTFGFLSFFRWVSQMMTSTKCSAICWERWIF